MEKIKVWPHLIIVVGLAAVIAGIGAALYFRHEQTVQAEALPNAARIQRVRSVLHEWTSQNKVKWYSIDDALLNDCLRKFSPRYPEISVPVSILAGDSDLCVSEKDNAERLHQALPKSHLIGLTKTGHEIPSTRSQSVVDEIERVQRLSRVRT